MPEYSTPKVTPTETTKIPGMNGNSSGYIDAKDLLDIIRATFGQANGVATLGSDGKLTSSQLPDLADDVIVATSYATLPSPGISGKLYITADNNKMYRWDDTLSTPDYVELSVDLSAYATKADLQDGTLEPLISTKARQDQYGNVIDLTYATKAEANDLKNALTAVDHRVQNLESAKGDYVVSNYKDGSITPSGKGAWAIVEGLRGVSRVENQMVKNGSLAESSTSWTLVSSTWSNGKIVATATGAFIYQQLPTLLQGHKYAVSFRLKSSVATTKTRVQVFCPSPSSYAFLQTSIALSPNTWKEVDGIAEAQITNSSFYIYVYHNDGEALTAGDTLEVEVSMRDLSVYFNGTIPSDADTIAEIQTNYPHLLTPSEYGTRIVDSSYSGVRAEGANLFNKDDFTLFNGYVASNGVLTASTGGEKTFICKAFPSQAYYFIRKESYGRIASFTSNPSGGDTGTIVSTSSDTAFTFTTLAGTAYLAITFRNSHDNNYTYEQDIEGMYLGYGTSGSFTPWREPSTLSLSFQGKSAGSVADTCEPNVEVEGVEKKRTTQRVGTIVYDGSDDEDWVSSVGGRFYIALHSLIKVQNYIGYILPSRLSIVGNNLDMTDVDNCITAFKDSGTPAYPNQNWLYVRINSTITSVALLKAWLAQNPITVNYALATESVTLSDPILDNTLLTEAGGRMATVQTGTVVDGSFDMGFITL